VRTAILEGFFPKNDFNDHPKKDMRHGLNKFSLNYAQDPAITKHLARFLSVRASEGEKLIAPSAILFNGGVFKPKGVRDRLLNIVNYWLSSEGFPATIELKGNEYDTSVAYGATIFGQAQLGYNIKIYGGSSHAFYIGIESSLPAIPGFTPPIEALCIAPQGMEYGKHLYYRQECFSLVVGEPVQFRFFMSNRRVQDQLGTIVQNWQEAGLVDIGTITITLSAKNYCRGEIIPVYISAMHTEIGTLELFATAVDSAEQWKISLETVA
jgi:hypothetical protein